MTMSCPICIGCEKEPAVEDGFCDSCADWCRSFFQDLFPDDGDKVTQ